MKEYITGDDIANTVRMVGSQRSVTFVLVEGVTDALWLKPFIADGQCDVLACYGRTNVIVALARLDESCRVPYLAIVDADFDHLLGQPPVSPHCIFTEFHDLEIDLVCSPAMDRLLSERGSPEKISSIEVATGMSICDTLLRSAAELGYIRLVSHQRRLALDFSDLNYGRLLVPDTLTLDGETAARTVAQRSHQAATAPAILEWVEEVKAAAYDVRQVCCGHDIVALLSHGLRRILGSQRAIDVEPRTLELELRLAFDWDCLARTQVFQGVRSWEATHPGSVVLRRPPIPVRS